jgi:NAD+ kinase
MSIRRIMVVYKTSPYERYQTLGVLKGAGASRPDQARIRDILIKAHEDNQHAISKVMKSLERAPVEVMENERPTKRATAQADLVVTVGGDGTFLRTAQCVESTPILGVNSSPTTSMGHYCGVHANRFAEVLRGILDGDLEPVPLTRIAMRVNGRILPHRALNDVLFAHRSPAGASRYMIRVDNRTELQVSSGIWVATPSGATGAILSAGGTASATDDGGLQYLVREPYVKPGEQYELTGGKLQSPIVLVSRNPHMTVFPDGHVRSHRVPYGSNVSLERDPEPLAVFGYVGSSRPA